MTAKGGKAIIDTTTGEVEDVAEIVSVHRVDNEQFVKIFTSNLKQFFNLKPTTYRMVQVLLHQLGRARPRYGLSQRQRGGTVFHLYRSEPDFKSILLQRHARTHPKRVHRREHQPEPLLINPALFFNGDRVRFVKEYRNTDWRQQQLDLADQAVQIPHFQTDD